MKPPSLGRASPRGAEGPSSQRTQLPCFHLGLVERRADLDTELWAEGGPLPRLPVGARGRAPRPQLHSLDGAIG